jgi:hypothetical protein
MAERFVFIPKKMQGPCNETPTHCIVFSVHRSEHTRYTITLYFLKFESMRYRYLILLAILACVAACRKNFDVTNDYPVGPVTPSNVEAGLVGQVLDDRGRPVTDADVVVAGRRLKTTAEGRFFLDKGLLDANGTLIKVIKKGFFEASRFVYPSLGSVAQAEIKMLPKRVMARFEASTGSTFSAGNVASITVPAGAIVRSNGSTYSGPVVAYAVWLDPTAPTTAETMPGDLRGLNANNQVRMLRTFGMVGVELESPSGEALNIGAGKKATIKAPVAPTLLSSAPTTIPLWHFDESTGYWREEGSAMLRGGVYEGEVSHFSFWNLDEQVPLVFLRGALTDQGGVALGFMQVRITSHSGKAFGVTDSKGQFAGPVPKGEPLKLEVLDRCEKVIYENNIGNLTDDRNLGNLRVNIANRVTVNGTLKDCTNATIAGGLVNITDDNGNTIASGISRADGKFDISLSNCTNLTAVRVLAYDIKSQKRSFDALYSLNGDNTVSTGNFQVCIDLGAFLQIEVERGSTVLFSDVHYSISETSDRLIATSLGDSTVVFMVMSPYNEITKTINLENIVVKLRPNEIYNGIYCAALSSRCPNLYSAAPITITQFDKQNKVVTGTVTGVFNEGNKFKITFRAPILI